MKSKFIILISLLISFQIGKSQFNIDFTSTVVCQGNTTQFTSYSNPTNATSWYWDFGDGNTSTTQNPSHIYSNTGTYFVQLIASDGSNIDSIIKPTDVFPKPIANYSFQNVCEYNSVQFQDMSTISSGAIGVWEWDLNGDSTTNSFSQNPIWFYTVSGIYNIQLIVISNMGCRDTTIIPLTIYPKPTVDFTYTMNGDTVQFIDQSLSLIAQWNWDLGNGTTSNFANPIANYPYPPDSCYDVTLSVISQYGCSDSLTKYDYICIDSTTSINEIKNKPIYIYPTPISSNQKLTIKGELKGLEKITGYNIIGTLINFSVISKNENELIFETNQLDRGVYFLRLLFDDKTIITKKIIIQ